MPYAGIGSGYGKVSKATEKIKFTDRFFCDRGFTFRAVNSCRVRSLFWRDKSNWLSDIKSGEVWTGDIRIRKNAKVLQIFPGVGIGDSGYLLLLPAVVWDKT